jgi:hypothetical protein
MVAVSLIFLTLLYNAVWAVPLITRHIASGEVEPFVIVGNKARSEADPFVITGNKARNEDDPFIITGNKARHEDDPFIIVGNPVGDAIDAKPVCKLVSLPNINS